MYKSILFTFGLSILGACQNSSLTAGIDPDSSYAEEDPQAGESIRDPTLEKVAEQDRQRKVIRTAEVKFQVEDVEESTDYVKNVVATFKGFITQMEQSNDTYSIKNNFVIKTPAAQFEPLLNALNQEAVFVNYKKIKSADVSSEFIDIEARLAAKKAVRDRYIDILCNKTGAVKDILEAEEKIRRIQEEIEAKEARIRYLKTQVSLSTIHLSIYQKVEYRSEPIVYRESFVGKLSKRFQNGWQALLGVLLFIINFWPLFLVASLVFWQRKRIFPHLKKGKE